MSDWTNGVGEAVPLVVPLVADNVLGPRVTYGPMPAHPGDPSLPLDAIVFPLENDLPGRVTFEGLDAIRAARGELLPYQRRDVPFTRGEWVYVVEGSAWLEERPTSAVTHRSTSRGIEWELRTNLAPIDHLVGTSRLCSQRLLQYNLILDGQNREHASVWVRTRGDRTLSSFVTGFFDRDRSHHVGIADAETFATRWRTCIEAVAHRRHELGRQQLPPDAQDTPPDTT